MGFGGCFCDGSEPDGLNEANCGGGATWIGLTADGAAAFLDPPLALPMPNAAPNATSAATLRWLPPCPQSSALLLGVEELGLVQLIVLADTPFLVIGYLKYLPM